MTNIIIIKLNSVGSGFNFPVSPTDFWIYNKDPGPKWAVVHWIIIIY